MKLDQSAFRKKAGQDSKQTISWKVVLKAVLIAADFTSERLHKEISYFSSCRNLAQIWCHVSCKDTPTGLFSF